MKRSRRADRYNLPTGGKAGILVLIGVAVFTTWAAAGRSLAADERVAPFQLEEVDGKTFDSQHQMAGKIALLAFCRPAQAYSEHVLYDLREISRQFSDTGVIVAGIFSGPVERDDLRDLKKRLLIDFPLLLDPAWKLYGAFGVVVRPTVWLVDASGTRRFEFAGYHRDLQTLVAADVGFLQGKITEEERARRIKPSRAPSFEGTAGPSVRYKLARRLIESGKRDAAKRQLELAWSEKPPVALAGIELARILLEEGKTSEAAPILDKALALAPNNPLALGTKGLAVLREGKTDTALDLLRQAIENGATEPIFFYELGRILEQRGLAGEACGYFRRGFELLLRRQEGTH